MNGMLSKQAIQNLRTALAEAEELWPLIEEAVEAECPVDEESTRCQHLRRSLKKLIEVAGRPKSLIRKQ